MNSGNHSSASYHINSVEKESTSDKVERIVDTLEDIVNTFKTKGCPESKELLREILLRNHLLGGSPLEAAMHIRGGHNWLVNIFTDPKARKTPCSIALPKEIRRSRTPTKSDKRHAGLVRALMANKARMESNRCLVIDASFMEQPALDPSPNKPKLEREQQERQQENLQDPAVDPIFEDLIKPELERYKEPPPPEPDFEIIDEGKTERNPYDKSGREEVFK